MEEDIPESFQDSYDELAEGVELTEPKRGRGRPKGAKNKPKAQPPPSESEDEELPIKKKVIPKKKTKPPPEYEEEEPPKVVKKKTKPPPPDREEEAPPKRKKAHQTLDVEFDEPSQKRKAPIRIKRPVAAARPLMTLVAEAAQQHVVREKDRRRNFYESFLPL